MRCDFASLRAGFVHGVLSCVALALIAPAAEGRYIRPDLEQVPVERLVENLTKQAAASPKDAAVRFNLARLHAMAYAQKTDTAEVNKRDDKGGPWFGYEPNHVPFQVKESKDPKELEAARGQLAKAIERYQEVLKLDPKHLSAQLGYGWCLDQAGRGAEAIKQYRRAIALGWEKEKEMKVAGLGWHSVVAEAAGYLTPLLDKEKDKAELDELAARIEIVKKIPRPVTPIAVPLRAGLQAADLEDRAARVRFDADGSGLRHEWTWIHGDRAAWLVCDKTGSGKINSALQLFGNVTFWCFWDNGYQALAALDNDRDGQLTGGELKHLALWQDRNNDGVSQAGEVQPLAAHGIVALSCRYEPDRRHPDAIPFAPRGVTFANGETRPTYDLFLRRR